MDTVLPCYLFGTNGALAPNPCEVLSVCALWSKRGGKPSLQQQMAERTGRILSEAIDQRSKINLTLEKGLTNLRALTASVVKFNKTEITLEVASLKSASTAWVGSRLSCYFRIRNRENKNRAIFLTFECRITSVLTSPNGLVLFLVERPEEVFEAQQRRCVRVDVTEKRIASLSLWRELPAGVLLSEHQPLAASTNAPDSDLRLANISTTGLRFAVKNSSMKEIFPGLQKGSCFTVRFTAMREDDVVEQEFLVNAVLRNGFNDLEKKETSLGFEFVAEGSLDAKEKLKWEAVRTGEISALGPFIVKWNLLDFHSENRVE